MNLAKSFRFLALFCLLVAACGPTPAPVGADALQEVALYYYSPVIDMGAEGHGQCTEAGLVSLVREVPADLEGEDLIRATLERLLEDELSADEIAEGISSDFPLAGVELENVELVDGLLTLTFLDPQNQTSGGACRVSILRAQLEATALQFDAVEELRIRPVDLFQP